MKAASSLWLTAGMFTVMASQANASIYGFTCIQASAGDCAVNATNQLSMTVTPVVYGGQNAVSFVFRNVGNINSVITSIFWDDRTNNTDRTNQYFNFGNNVVGGGQSQGVNYNNRLAGTGTMARGNNLNPRFVVDVTARPSSSGGVASNGVEEGMVPVGDTLEVQIGLLNTRTLNDVINGLGNGTLRVGFHLQSLICPPGVSPCATSDTYINRNSPTTVTPEPTAVVGLSVGLAVVIWSHRRRKASVIS